MTNGSSANTHQMVRGLSKRNVTNPDYNVWSVEELDKQLSAWRRKGYEVRTITYLGEWDDAFFFHYYLEKPL